ncbi:MAG: hypothetical protein JNM58_02670 [Xanthomonadaceae bacterium]|nr:hypothetical protein [Xanthomonadaceae bacterium]
MRHVRSGFASTPHRGAWRLVLLTGVATAICACAPPPLHPDIAREYAESIRLGELAPPRYCGRLVEVRFDLNKIPDATPAYYDRTTGALVVRCDNPLSRRHIPPEQWTVCPPAEWRCGP